MSTKTIPMSSHQVGIDKFLPSLLSSTGIFYYFLFLFSYSTIVFFIRLVFIYFASLIRFFYVPPFDSIALHLPLDKFFLEKIVFVLCSSQVDTRFGFASIVATMSRSDLVLRHGTSSTSKGYLTWIADEVAF